MSLQERLTSLTQAVGADVKALNTALDGKAATAHTHAGLMPTGGEIGQQVVKSGSGDFATAWTWQLATPMTTAAMLALDAAANQYRRVLVTDAGPTGALFISKELPGIGWRWCPEGGSALLFHQNVYAGKTNADTTESAALASFTLPANLMHEAGGLRVESWFQQTSAVTGQTLRIRINGGGTFLYNQGFNANRFTALLARIRAVNSRNAQLFFPNNHLTTWGGALTNTNSLAVNFGADVTFSWHTQYGTAGDGSQSCGVSAAYVWLEG